MSSEEEKARDAIWKVVHMAWCLLDNTQNSDPPEVDQVDWDNLSKSLDELESLVPQEEGPTWGGFPASYLWDKFKK